MRLTVVDRFAAEARALRAHFDVRFSNPRSATADRFVWDLWHVPGQYTALRTPAWEFFPKKAYDAFHQRLVWWGRRTLGCHDVSPPWLSCYVNGCEQRLHGDLPHGPVAFVFSLTKWDTRTFRGGETLLVRDEVLDFWRGFISTRWRMSRCSASALRPCAAARAFRVLTTSSSSPRTSRSAMVFPFEAAGAINDNDRLPRAALAPEVCTRGRVRE